MIIGVLLMVLTAMMTWLIREPSEADIRNDEMLNDIRREGRI